MENPQKIFLNRVKSYNFTFWKLLPQFKNFKLYRVFGRK